MHYRTANLRRDAIHKLTTSLAREYGTIVVEDLNVAGMLKNRRLAPRHSSPPGPPDTHGGQAAGNHRHRPGVPRRPGRPRPDPVTGTRLGQ
ncbi:hypothetical protein BOG92_000385 [Streptomyces sp. WAC00263]|nr:hypothetical protein BOG92_000385 [Streptomyces sp. WAC00263]